MHQFVSMANDSGLPAGLDGMVLDSAMQNNSVTVGTKGLGLREGYFQNPSIEHTNGYSQAATGIKGVGTVDPKSIHRQIHEQCNTELWRHMPIEMFSGEAAQQSMYTYNEDFFGLGRPGPSGRPR